MVGLIVCCHLRRARSGVSSPREVAAPIPAKVPALAEILSPFADSSLTDTALGYITELSEEFSPRASTTQQEKEAADYLVKLYPDGSREEKTAVIHSMMIMDNTEGLLSLLKQENDPELKREMLQMLTTMDSEETDEYLFELLEKNG